MSPSQSFLLWFAQHLESLCLLLTCLDLSCFVLLTTSSHSVRGRFVSVSVFLGLFCLTPRVALLVDVVSTVSSFLNTLTRSGHSSDVSDSFLNTLTFVKLVLVSFSPHCRSNLLLLMFHSSELLNANIFISPTFQETVGSHLKPSLPVVMATCYGNNLIETFLWFQ